jgi:hypothetical protein
VRFNGPIDAARFRIEALGARVRLRCLGTNRIHRVPVARLVRDFTLEVQ